MLLGRRRIKEERIKEELMRSDIESKTAQLREDPRWDALRAELAMGGCSAERVLVAKMFETEDCDHRGVLVREDERVFWFDREELEGGAPGEKRLVVLRDATDDEEVISAFERRIGVARKIIRERAHQRPQQ